MSDQQQPTAQLAVTDTPEGCADASSSSSRYYRPELDVLRFIAFLFVFFTHRNDLAPIDAVAHPWLNALTMIGVYGVPVFFLLSAFLITELLERERVVTGRISPRAFYVRRILRIWPLYFLIFFGLVVLNQVLPGAGANTPGKWLAFTAFAGNWYITFNGWIEYPVNPMWSLSVEEQFYIAIPFLAMLGRRSLVLVNLAVIVVAYAVIAYYAQRVTPASGLSGQWTNSFVQFQFFAGGMLLALGLRGRSPNWPVVVRVGLFALAVTLWLVAFTVFEIKADNPRSTVAQSLAGWPLLLAGAALMLVSLLGISARHLPRPVIYLGRISYGLYMVHIIFFWLIYGKSGAWLTRTAEAAGLGTWRDTIGAVLAFAATVALASVLYRFFERPFLRLKTRFTVVPSRD